MRKNAASLLAFSVLLSSTGATSAAPFSDVQGTPYQVAFDYLSRKGVVQGYADGQGMPNKPLNRAEALKVILALRAKDRVEWHKQNMMPLPLFQDVDQDAWYAPYVEAAFEENMVTGYPDRTFRPAGLLKVEEAIAMALRAYNVEGPDDGAKLSPYIQNRDSEWFTPYINAAIIQNLIMHQGRMELGQQITRGRFFDIVYRLDKNDATGSLVFRGTEPREPVVARQRAQIAGGTSAAIHVPQPLQTASISYASEKHFSIAMPKLGIQDLTITHPADPFTADGVMTPLQYGVGHLFSYPGAGGKIMIYGHSSSYPWDVSDYTKIFRKVNQLVSGDRIYVTYDGKLFTYEVNYTQTIDAVDTSPFQDYGHGEELILYTCWPPDSIAQRYLVHAIPVSTVALQR